MNINPPKVSVIVAVYNVEKYLEKSINSILQQTFKEIEIILVDDGSTDSSGSICDRYALLDNRIIVIHKENQGLGSARNAGLESCSGEYIYFMDSDDWIESTLIEDNYKLAKTKNYDIVIFGFVKELSMNKGINYMTTLPPVLDIKDSNELKKLVISVYNSGCGFSVWNHLMKAEIIKKNNLKYPGYKRGCDMFFLFCLYSKIESLITNRKVYYHFNVFYTTKKYNPNSLENHIIYYDKFLNLFDGWLSIQKNFKFALKLYLLWFCHVIPIGIISNSEFSYKEKIQKFKEIYSNTKVSNWMKMFKMKDADNIITKILLFVFKLRSPQVLWFFTVCKNWFRKNVNVYYKKWFFK